MKSLLHLSTILALTLALCGCAKSPPSKEALNKALLNAVFSNQLDEVKTMLTQGADPNGTNKVITLLDEVILSPNQEIAKVLAEHGARCSFTKDSLICRDVIAKDSDCGICEWGCEVPLALVSTWGDTNLVTMFLEKGADPNANYPLFFAAIYGHQDAAFLLIKHGASITTNDCSGRTLLHAAAEGGCKELVEFALTNGIAVNATNYAGQTALDIAIQKKHPEIAEILRKHGAKESTSQKPE